MRSDVEGQAPLPADLVDGEIAVNLHVNSPALYLKDTVGTVRKIAGSGSQSLDDLTDCDTTAIPPTTGDSLIFDGTNFVPQVSASSPIGGASLAYEFEEEGELGARRYAASGGVRATAKQIGTNNIVVDLEIPQGWHIN